MSYGICAHGLAPGKAGEEAGLRLQLDKTARLRSRQRSGRKTWRPSLNAQSARGPGEAVLPDPPTQNCLPDPGVVPPRPTPLTLDCFPVCKVNTR